MQSSESTTSLQGGHCQPFMKQNYRHHMHAPWSVGRPQLVMDIIWIETETMSCCLATCLSSYYFSNIVISPYINRTPLRPFEGYDMVGWKTSKKRLINEVRVHHKKDGFCLQGIVV